MAYTTAPHADFAERLHWICNHRGMASGRQRTTVVADLFGVSRETARLWFAGRTLPELQRVIAIALEFDCSLDWLMLGRTPPASGQLQIAESAPSYTHLSPEEQTVIRGMRHLSSAKRAGLVALMKSH